MRDLLDPPSPSSFAVFPVSDRVYLIDKCIGLRRSVSSITNSGRVNCDSDTESKLDFAGLGETSQILAKGSSVIGHNEALLS